MAEKIDRDILILIAGLSCEGDLAHRIAVQLDRKVYLALNAVLEALGGKWNKKRNGHVFPGDAAEFLADVVTFGEYVDAKREFQQFFTPPELAATVCKLAEISKGMKCLEPSAGEGAIAYRMAALGGNVDCVELDSKLAVKLSPLDMTNIRCCDFLTLKPEPIYDRIGMNPPFARSQDIAHVRHAFNFLKPGGKLVSIMGVGFTFRNDKKATDFRNWIEQHSGRWQKNTDGAFRESGTMVNTVTVVMQKAA